MKADARVLIVHDCEADVKSSNEVKSSGGTCLPPTAAAADAIAGAQCRQCYPIRSKNRTSLLHFLCTDSQYAAGIELLTKCEPKRKPNCNQYRLQIL